MKRYILLAVLLGLGSLIASIAWNNVYLTSSGFLFLCLPIPMYMAKRKSMPDCLRRYCPSGNNF